MRNPAAVSLSSIPRLPYSSARVSSASRTSAVVGRTPSSKSSTSSAGCSGLPAASSAASTTLRTCDSFMSVLRGGNRRLCDRQLLLSDQLAGTGFHGLRCDPVLVVRYDAQYAVRRSCAHMQRCKRLRLDDVDQTFAHQLEDGDEGDRDPHAA